MPEELRYAQKEQNNHQNDDRFSQAHIRIIGFPRALFNCPPSRPFLERVLKTFIITLMDPKEIKALIEAGMPGSSIDVEGDGTHFEAVIVSSDFNGKTLLERHQQVYKILGEAMKERIHALSLKTYTPEQWEKIK